MVARRGGLLQGIGVDDGTRTHDDRDHNPGLYQLSYAHHRGDYRTTCISSFAIDSGAPGRTRTCNRRLSLPTTAFAASVSSLWSGLSLHRHRCCTYSLYGSPSADVAFWLARVSTGLPSALPVKGSPLQCSPLYRFCFPAQAPHSKADALSS